MKIDEVKCSEEAPVHDFLTATTPRCLERCPPGFIKDDRVLTLREVKKIGGKSKIVETKKKVELCTKEGIRLSEDIKINRGIRDAVGKKEVKSIFNSFPDRVVDEIPYKRGPKKGKVRARRFKIAIDPENVKTKKDLERETGELLQSKNFVACETAARNLKVKAKLPKPSIFGKFSGLANLQRKGTLAKDVFNSCRDYAYCELHRLSGNESKLFNCACDLGSRGDAKKMDKCCSMARAMGNDAVVNICQDRGIL